MHLNLALYIFCACEKYFIDHCPDTVIFYLLQLSLATPMGRQRPVDGVTGPTPLTPTTYYGSCVG